MKYGTFNSYKKFRKLRYVYKSCNFSFKKKKKKKKKTDLKCSSNYFSKQL